MSKERAVVVIIGDNKNRVRRIRKRLSRRDKSLRCIVHGDKKSLLKELKSTKVDALVIDFTELAKTQDITFKLEWQGVMTIRCYGTHTLSCGEDKNTRGCSIDQMVDSTLEGLDSIPETNPKPEEIRKIPKSSKYINLKAEAAY